MLTYLELKCHGLKFIFNWFGKKTKVYYSEEVKDKTNVVKC